MLAVLLLALAGTVRAQPAADQLQAAESGAAVFDGASHRRDGPLEIVSETTGVVQSTWYEPARVECHGPPGELYHGMTGARPNAFRDCDKIPPHLLDIVVDSQTVRIADRDAYVQQAGDKGARIGALLGGAAGALGFLTLIAGPIGWAIGTGTVLLGALVGSIIGGAVGSGPAKDAPYVFDRTVNRRAVSRPLP